MSKIRVKHFGPIREGRLDSDGWIDIRKVTLFLGDQGTGKSTLAKVLATMTWMEKTLVRGDHTVDDLLQAGKLQELLQYHRIHKYFKSETELEYQGQAAHIHYHEGQLHIELKTGETYALPQVMYVPSERNFISYMDEPDLLKLAAGNLTEFLTEFVRAKKALDKPMLLPFGNTSLQLHEPTGALHVVGDFEDESQPSYAIRLSETSSGYQSSVPLLLVTDYLNKDRERSLALQPLSSLVRDLNPAQLDAVFMKVSGRIGLKNAFPDLLTELASNFSRFRKTHLINIVEEPEQNLFPDSQWRMLESLLAYNNQIADNKLVMTSHSPYLINVLSVAIKAHAVLHKLQSHDQEQVLRERVASIFHTAASTPGDEVTVYQLAQDGRVDALPSIEGVPTDENLLNLGLRKCNEAFDALYDIEDEL